MVCAHQPKWESVFWARGGLGGTQADACGCRRRCRFERWWELRERRMGDKGRVNWTCEHARRQAVPVTILLPRTRRAEIISPRALLAPLTMQAMRPRAHGQPTRRRAGAPWHRRTARSPARLRTASSAARARILGWIGVGRVRRLLGVTGCAFVYEVRYARQPARAAHVHHPVCVCMLAKMVSGISGSRVDATVRPSSRQWCGLNSSSSLTSTCRARRGMSHTPPDACAQTSCSQRRSATGPTSVPADMFGRRNVNRASLRRHDAAIAFASADMGGGAVVFFAHQGPRNAQSHATGKIRAQMRACLFLGGFVSPPLLKKR